MSEIEDLKAENEKLKLILRRAFPEKSGLFFISGASTEVDENGQPESVSLCATYGLDWSVHYKRVR
mgnify:FL=1